MVPVDTPSTTCRAADPAGSQQMKRLSPGKRLVHTTAAGRSRFGFFGKEARQARLGIEMVSHTRSVSQQESNPGDKRGITARKVSQAAAARTRKLKSCKTSQQLLTTLRAFTADAARPLNSIQLSTVYARLPTYRDNTQQRVEVLVEVSPDVDAVLGCGFHLPYNSELVDTQALATVSWGMLKLGYRWDISQQCAQTLALLDENLESCGSVSLAVALDCFVAFDYYSDGLTPERVARLIRSNLHDAASQTLARLLSCCGKIGITDVALQLQLGQKLSEVVNEPQHCANGALALARSGTDAQGVVKCLVERLVTMEMRPDPQEIANTFLALHERGWTVSRDLANDLLHLYMENQGGVIALDHVQVLTGVEKHGVRAEDVDVTPLVQQLVESCPRGVRSKLAAVADSLSHTTFGYMDVEHVRKLRELASQES